MQRKAEEQYILSKSILHSIGKVPKIGIDGFAPLITLLTLLYVLKCRNTYKEVTVLPHSSVLFEYSKIGVRVCVIVPFTIFEPIRKNS